MKQVRFTIGINEHGQPIYHIIFINIKNHDNTKKREPIKTR